MAKKIAKFLEVGGRRPFFFMEDGAPTHRAKSTKTWQVAKGITLFKLPRFESNREPLEPSHTRSGKNAQNQKGIKKIAQKVWKQVTPTYLEMLYESMPGRMQAVVEGQGGHSKY